jgi:serine/threonine protein kinase
MRMGGVTEVAEMLGVSRQRVAKLRGRPDFPDPLGELAQGPVWDLDAVQAWNGSGLRQSTAGRPRAEVAARTLGGRFVLEEPKIGEGGFADVYRAVDRKQARPGAPLVAVKLLRDVQTVDPEAIRRFKRELRLLEQLEHPNVIPILGHGETAEDGVWYAMPLAQGSLAAYIDEIDANPAEIVDLMRQVCAGLAYVHDQGIFHRDLKPGNVLRTANGSWAISDFGLAVEAERNTTVLTSTLRAGLGSWWYTAPEQWKAARSANHLSDVYSLGKVLQELVTGEPPVNNDMPPGPLRPIVQRATANRPEQRYQSVAEFLDALEHAVEAPKGKWETAEDVAKRLLERVRLPKPAPEDLDELFTWSQRLDENDSDDMAALCRVLPWISGWSIKQLWHSDIGAFQRVFYRYGDYIAERGFSFEYCDVLADFCRRAVEQTQDTDVLRTAVRSLANLGANHNRWHVRDVLTELLQSIRDTETALTAVEGLQAADDSAVRWSVTDFSLRSLHPALRSGIQKLLEQSHAS